MDDEKLHEMDKSVHAHDLRLKHLEGQLPTFATKERVDMVEAKMKDFAPLESFMTVKTLVFGLVGLILVAVVTVILNSAGISK